MSRFAIDIHTHVVPAEFPRYAGRSQEQRWPEMRSCEDHLHKRVIIDGKTYRRVHRACWDTAVRMQDMAEEGVERQVLSPMPELLSYWFGTEDALSMSHYVNDVLAEMVHAAPQHFSAFGMVPLQAPEQAAKEVEQLAKMGFVGIEVGSNVNGVAIGDPRFDPFFEAAERSGMAVFVHSLHTLGIDRIVGEHPLLPTFLAFPSEIGLAAASIITGGTLDRHPDLRIACSHGGGAFPVTLFRFRHGVEAMAREGVHLLQHPVEEYARMLFYDTVVYDPRVLAYLLDVIGADRILVGSDYPFVMREPNPGAKVSALSLDAQDQEKILRGNAIQFLGLGEAG